MGKSVDKIIEGGSKTALRWKEELPSVLTSCGEAFNYSIDKTGDAVWAGVFEKDKPNEAARFKVCADEDEAREFCKLIEGSGKLPLCMGRNASSEGAGTSQTGVETITLPEYGEELQEVSGSGRMPKGAQFGGMDEHGAAEAVIAWLYNSDWMRGYSDEEAVTQGFEGYYFLVRSALDELFYTIISILENEMGIKESARVGQNVDLGGLSEMELKKMAIRDNMKAENDAIMMYSKYIDMLPEGDAVRVGLEDIRNEEKEHAGELHKLLVDLDPSEKKEFDEGIGEVEKETDGEEEEDMDQGNTASRKTAAQVAALAKIANRASDLARDIANYLEGEYFESVDDVRAFVDDEIDGSLIYTDDVLEYAKEYVPDGELQERVTPMFYEQLSEDVYSALGDLEDYVSGEDDEEDRSASRKAMARRKASRLRRKHGNWRKAASAGLAPEVGRHDKQVPFYAYYEGKTKDKKATIGVVQQQLGSRPQLTVISNKGEIRDFGFLPNMDYALRQASRFEEMTCTELLAAAPPQTVRVTTAGKTAQYASESWNKVGDDYWYKGIGESGSINVSWEGWTNLPGNLYYDERGCYAYYDGEIDGSYNGSIEVARVKTISIAGLPSETFQEMSYDEILAKYNNPQDGFCEKGPAVEYCARLADEWLAQNEQRLA